MINYKIYQNWGQISPPPFVGLWLKSNVQVDSATGDDRRTISQQGTFRLCAGDTLIAFVSKNGNGIDANDATADNEENNSCSTEPCGSHALCWNGDGASYLCTCQPDHPHGNTYYQQQQYLQSHRSLLVKKQY